MTGPQPFRLTLTFEINGADSVEKAQVFVEGWLAGQTGIDARELRPIKVQATAADGARRAFKVPGPASRSEIARRRRALGLTQRALAARAGLDQSHVSVCERGLISPQARSYQTILAALQEAEARP